VSNIKHFFAISMALAGIGIGSVSAQALVNDNAQRMQACTTCHGAGVTAVVGRTANEQFFPRIAGKPEQYLFNQLVNYRDGRRHYGLMVHMVEHLSDDYLREMARYFSQLDLPYPEPQAPRPGTSAQVLARGQQLALQGDASKGVASCAACHGQALMGVQPAIPGLLGLPRDYIAAQVGAWQTGVRRAHAPDCMAQIAKKLTPDDVNAVSSWIAAQRIPAGAKPQTREQVKLPLMCGGMP
jgi:cytochrome c553